MVAQARLVVAYRIGRYGECKSSVVAKEVAANSPIVRYLLEYNPIVRTNTIFCDKIKVK
jgi:hypothetical protein